MSSSTKKKIKKFKYGELFSGPGGLSLGASRALVKGNDGVEYKITHAWASDYDEDSCATYRHNIAKENPDSVLCEDVTNLDLNKLEKVDAFAYGFPCNDFSIVGEQKGFNGTFGPLYTYGVTHTMPPFRYKVDSIVNDRGYKVYNFLTV